MATLNWPGFGITQITPSLDQPAQVNRSAYTGARAVASNPWHGKWSFKVTLATTQGDANFQAIRAFFTSLSGQINNFHLPAVEAPQNGNTGVTLSAAAAQGANSLALTGVTTALVAGNMITIAGQLLSLTSVGTLSSGAQTVNFMPALRAAAASGASVETAKPYALVALSDSSFSWDIAQWRLYGLSFTADEDVSGTDGASPSLDVWTPTIGGSGGGGSTFSFPQLPSFSSRTLLAAVPSPTDKQVAFLTEPGREGEFVFTTANNSTNVTNDPQQGIYVAPSSDTTGASGAWVRKFTMMARHTWWGCAADGVTDDHVAFASAVATLRAIRLLVVSGTGYGNGASIFLYCPGATWLAANSISVDYALHIWGDGNGVPGGEGSKIMWADGVIGLNFVSGSAGWRVSNITLVGGFTTTESNSHGIAFANVGSADHVSIYNFSGDGFFNDTRTAGNVNGYKFNEVYVQNCRNAIGNWGANSNGAKINGLEAISNRQAGIMHQQGLGNIYDGYLLEGNASTAWNTGAAGKPCSYVYNNGHRFACVAGQETGASTNSPPSTATSNQWWAYWYDAGATTWCPQWVSGINVRAGGGIIHQGASDMSRFSGYQETDECSQIDQQGMVIVPSGAPSSCYFQNSSGVLGAAGGNPFGARPAFLRGAGSSAQFDSGLNVAGRVVISGDSHSIGPQSGAAADTYVYLDCTNVNAFIQARAWSGGVPTNVCSFQFSLSNGITYNVANVGYSHSFQVNGSAVATISSAGLLTVSGALGYSTGAGGTVTQATSKSTAVTINKSCGQITTNGAALAAGTAVSFTVNNSQVAATDTLDLCLQSGNATAGTYNYQIDKISAGSFVIWIKNISAGSLSEALVFNFSVSKSVTS